RYQVVQYFPQGSATIGAYVVDSRPAQVTRHHISIHQVGGVDKLKFDITGADDVYTLSSADPVEQDLKNPEPSFPKYRPRSDHNQCQPRALRDSPHGQFT